MIRPDPPLKLYVTEKAIANRIIAAHRHPLHNAQISPCFFSARLIRWNRRAIAPGRTKYFRLSVALVGQSTDTVSPSAGRKYQIVNVSRGADPGRTRHDYP